MSLFLCVSQCSMCSILMITHYLRLSAINNPQRENGNWSSEDLSWSPSTVFHVPRQLSHRVTNMAHVTCHQLTTNTRQLNTSDLSNIIILIRFSLKHLFRFFIFALNCNQDVQNLNFLSFSLEKNWQEKVLKQRP